MELTKLKIARFFTPAIMALLFYWLLGFITGAWDFNIHGNLMDLQYAPISLLIAFPYYILRISFISNRLWFNELNEYIRSNLVKISGCKDDPRIITWRKIRVIYYDFIDNDESLKNKSKLVYANGLAWSTCADLRAISLIAFFAATIMYFIHIDNSVIVASICIVLCISSFPLSDYVTKNHKRLAQQQIDIIEEKYKSELKARIKAVKN